MPMNCSQTLSEPKNKFHCCIDQFFSCADVENRQRPWKILANPDLLKLKESTCSFLEKDIALNFFLKILKSHRNRVTVHMQSF